MAPLAAELALRHGVLEPLQTASSIAGQVEELKELLEGSADLPITLVGHSWGAWLAYIFAAHHPGLVRKLILVSSGGFEEKYAAMTHETRLSRLNKEDRDEVNRLLEIIRNRSADDRNADFARLGELFFKTDAYDPLPLEPPETVFSLEIYKRVWGEATELRRSGKLLEMGREITSPVVAIHGRLRLPSRRRGGKAPLRSYSGISALYSWKTAGTSHGSNGRRGRGFMRYLKGNCEAR